MALDSSPENPAPLRVINAKIAEWVSRLGSVWVEAQVTQISARRGMSQAFIEVRDVDQNLSARVATSPAVLAGVQPALSDGDRIVLLVKPEFWTNRGQLVLRASQIRAVGIGDLLARIERLKQQLAGEGLFALDRKRPLPFLPKRIGLICGRDSAAQHDVVENVARRWPGIEFELRQVPVQGPEAAREVTQALADLDRIPDVDVIVISRGGGSVEDLLAFSEEGLIRAVAACTTPVVSAIGHEQDSPLIDLVADVRASTPTDAARAIVPDMREQFDVVNNLRQRSRRVVLLRIDREEERIQLFADHPYLADPSNKIADATSEVDGLSNRCRRSLAHQLQLASSTVGHQRVSLRAYSPAATLDRGYAIVFDANRSIVTSRTEVANGDALTLKLSEGEVGATAQLGED